MYSHGVKRKHCTSKLEERMNNVMWYWSWGQIYPHSPHLLRGNRSQNTNQAHEIFQEALFQARQTAERFALPLAIHAIDYRRLTVRTLHPGTRGLAPEDQGYGKDEGTRSASPKCV